MKGAERLFARVEEFKFLSASQRAKLAESAQVERYLLGQVVFEEGQPGDRFCVVHSGRVRIVKSAGQREVSLATLNANQTFGEISLVKDVPRTATARSAGKTTLITVKREAFLAVLEDSPGLREFYERQIESRTFKTFLQALTSFGRELGAQTLQQLSTQARTQQLEVQQTLVVAPGSLYVLCGGELDIVRTRKGEERAVSRLRPGETCGEDRLEGEVHFTFRARQACEVYELPPESLAILRARAPRFEAYLERRITRWRRLSELEFVGERGLDVDEEQDTPDDVSEEEGTTKASERRFPGLGIRKFPFVAQASPLDAGVACMTMLARHFNLKVEANFISAVTRPRATGGSLEPLADAAERLGFHARVSPATYDLLLATDLPAVVHWRGGQSFAIVYRVDKKHVWLADPAEGLRRYAKSAFLKLWTRQVLLIELAPRFKPAQGKWAWLRFLEYLRPHRGLLLQLAIGSLVLQLLGLASPKFTELIVDRIVVHQDHSLLHVIVVGMLLVALGSLLIGAVRTYIVAIVGRRISFAMLRNFYAHMLRLPLSWFQSHAAGDLVQRFEDNDEIKELMMGKTVGVFLDSALVVVYLAMMLAYSPTLTGISLATIAPMVALLFLQAPVNMRFDREQFDADAAEDSILLETIHGAETIKTLGMERQAFTKWEEALARKLNLDYDQAMFGIGIGGVSEIFHHGGTLLILWLGAHKVIAGELSMGQLLAFAALSQHVFDPLMSLVGVFSEVQEAQVALERLNEVFDAEPEDEPGDAGIVELAHVEGNVTFENVRFRYDAEGPWILDGVSCEIAAGKSLALVGRSGSGKSTLAKLLVRHFVPQEGRVLIDGVDISQVSTTSLRRAVSSVLQRPFLFNATIRENITLDPKLVDPERLEWAANLAAAAGFVTAMPLEYESSVGEGGGNLSGGQRQRISIARALYQDPRVFVMDEATSALDTESELAIQRNMEDFLRDRTAVLIAHRMSTIRSADKILVLDQGKVVEEGNHQALMEQRGLYYHLCSQQIGG